MITLDHELCFGCEACINICPVGAIFTDHDERGFTVPRIQNDKCINCNLCEKVCPKLHPEKFSCNSSNPVALYAAYSTDVNIRYTSTSGGTFSAIADEFIRSGGYVCGAIYDDTMTVRHYITNNANEIKKLRQSKYVQSIKDTVFNEIKMLLLSGKKVLFVGCPCEVTALLNIVGADNKNLYTIDFVCLGANSPLAYNSYKEYLEKKYHSTIDTIWFKHKKYSWNRFSTYVRFQNGNIYQKDRYSDFYMRCYIEKQLIIRKSCQHCDFKGIPHGSDFTLADFWGVENFIKGIDSSNGVSLVSVNSEKGRVLLSGAEKSLYLASVDASAYGKNPMSQKQAVIDKDSDPFFAVMKSKGFEAAARKYLNHSVTFYLKRAYRQVKIKIYGR